MNGLVAEIASTREGSEVIFQYNATAIAVCSRDGRWSPDPGQRVCGFQSGMTCNNCIIYRKFTVLPNYDTCEYFPAVHVIPTK